MSSQCAPATFSYAPKQPVEYVRDSQGKKIGDIDNLQEKCHQYVFDRRILSSTPVHQFNGASAGPIVLGILAGAAVGFVTLNPIAGVAFGSAIIFSTGCGGEIGCSIPLPKDYELAPPPKPGCYTINMKETGFVTKWGSLTPTNPGDKRFYPWANCEGKVYDEFDNPLIYAECDFGELGDGKYIYIIPDHNGHWSHQLTITSNMELPSSVTCYLIHWVPNEDGEEGGRWVDDNSPLKLAFPWLCDSTGAPPAVPSMPGSGYIGQQIPFKAIGSSDDTHLCTWDFRDLSKVETGCNITHAFTFGATFPVKLTVSLKNDPTRKSSKERDIYIDKAPAEPTAIKTKVPAVVKVNQKFTLEVENPDTKLTYTWYVGQDSSGKPITKTGAKVEGLFYAATGSGIVSLKITDPNDPQYFVTPLSYTITITKLSDPQFNPVISPNEGNASNGKFTTNLTVDVTDYDKTDPSNGILSVEGSWGDDGKKYPLSKIKGTCATPTILECYSDKKTYSLPSTQAGAQFPVHVTVKDKVGNSVTAGPLWVNIY